MDSFDSTKGITVPYQVRILLLEGDLAFQNEFCEMLREGANGIRLHIETCDGLCLHEKGECDTEGDFDIYICGSSLKDHSSVLEFIQFAKSKDAGATIFVLSDSKDPNLLKKIVKMNVEGLIDRDSLDLSALLQEIKIVAETYSKVSNMVEKLNRLSALKSVA